jgi:putative transposase
MLMRKPMRRGNFASKNALLTKIEQFISYFNRTMAKPFRRTMAKPLTG